MRIVSCGMAIALAALSLAGSALAAPVETVLHSFIGSDGVGPAAGLIADKEGALYSTTGNGGTSNLGTVFKLTPPAKGQTAWKETVLYNFCSQPNCNDGANPLASLITDNSGALYSTTFNNGSGNKGTVFKLTPPAKGQTAWIETVLHSFTGGSDGGLPYAGLIADKEGALYGTTSGGGIAGNGTVFKLTPPAKGQTAWIETVLHSFTGGSDGASPVAGLIADKEGTLYGTTGIGGSGSHGTAFKLTPPAKGQTTWIETVLYSFTGGSDGGFPPAGLIAENGRDENRGALYGTTLFGGTGNNGTVFKLTPPAKGQTAWTETVLHSFTGGSDGGFPYAGLIADKEGALYGTTQVGGNSSNGTVFKLTLGERLFEEK
jgi:uncharacterized repeat protein (TIGR03803 family)